MLAKFEELALWERFNEFGMIEKEMRIYILKKGIKEKSINDICN